MTPTIWLASYPKSGNTWFRMLTANLSARDDRPVDINDLPEGGAIASARSLFDDLSLAESGLLTHDEAERLRPLLHGFQASDAGDVQDDDTATPVRFVKVHDAYTHTTDGQPLLAGRHGADGAIVIVRDPRGVAPSLAAHMARSLDAAIAFMNDMRACFSGASDRQPLQLRQRLLTWSAHVASWLDQRDIPVHVVRYEDLHADTAGTFRKALAFAGLPASDADIRRAVAFADFAELRRQEQARGFREAPDTRSARFFRRGERAAWRHELTRKQIQQLEEDHGPMMERLAYAPAEVPAASVESEGTA